MINAVYDQLKLVASIIVISTLLAGCQPPTQESTVEPSKSVDSTEPLLEPPIAIDENTIAISSSNILNIKSSRYQPSLGLQGTIEPANNLDYKTIKPVFIEQVLVQDGQWVESGTPLLILQPITTVSSKKTPIISLSMLSQAVTDVASSKSSKGIVSTNDAINKESSVKRVQNDDSTDGDATIEIADTLDTQNQSDSVIPQQLESPIIVQAGASGRINQLALKENQSLKANTLLLSIGDDTDLIFKASVAIQAQAQLSVGQSVNFITQKDGEKYTGQVSKLIKDKDPTQLSVHVQLPKKDISQIGGLRRNMTVVGRVNYGQIKVGTIVPEIAIHDANLAALQLPPYQPLKPLTANVWIIQQDQRLTRQPVEVINYDPTTKQYLIAGINNDSLICLADLPVESAGKRVVVS